MGACWVLSFNTIRVLKLGFGVSWVQGFGMGAFGKFGIIGVHKWGLGVLGSGFRILECSGFGLSGRWMWVIQNVEHRYVWVRKSVYIGDTNRKKLGKNEEGNEDRYYE